MDRGDSVTCRMVKMKLSMLFSICNGLFGAAKRSKLIDNVEDTSC